MVVLLLFCFKTNGQLQKYYYPTDSTVVSNLNNWQQLKFGLLMHWGAYSQWGVVESWSICSEDENWCVRRGPFADDYEAYKKSYEALQHTFNPTLFNPVKWAEAAASAGMKYVIFTTKHHDGFCMFDTRYTNYKVTDTSCPYHVDSKANITAEVFEAFRAKGFKTGAYFSKPDWHCQDYWWSKFATPNRCSNYDTKKYPDKWQAFENFTYNQLNELTTEYGKLDILWLDGGQVRPDSTITDEERPWVKVPYTQEINMHRIAAMARKNQPGILIVDRSVYGHYQNYLTPEQQIPDKPLNYPWETCLTMATSWSYVPNDTYKSATDLIHTLIDIVAKGGNLLLNIGPDEKGQWHADAYDRLKHIGIWMQQNSNCIYNTKVTSPYKSNNVCFTQNDKNVYAIFLVNDNETFSNQLEIKNFVPTKNASAKLLGCGKVSYKTSNGNTIIQIPSNYQKPNNYAWVIAFSK